MNACWSGLYDHSSIFVLNVAPSGMLSLWMAPGIALTSLMASVKQSAKSPSNLCISSCCESVMSGPMGTSCRIQATHSALNGLVLRVRMESFSSVVMTYTSCGAGSVPSWPGIGQLPWSSCLTLRVRLTPWVLGSYSLGLVSLFCRTVVVLFFDLISTVSVLKFCIALNHHKSGLPSRNAQLPPLSKTSKDTLMDMSFNSITLSQRA